MTRPNQRSRTARARGARGALAAALLFAACAGEPAEDVIVLGAQIPLTGPLSLSGEFYHNALLLAEEDINAAGGIGGKPVRIVFEDARDSNSSAVNAFNKLVREHRPVAVFLSSYSTHDLATEPDVTKAGIPALYAGGAVAITERKNPLMFRIRPSDRVQAQAMARYTVETLGKTKPGILHIQNDFGQGGARAAQESFAALGVTVVGVEAYRETDKDMSAQILGLRNAGADILLSFSQALDGALVIKQVSELGVRLPLFVSSGAYVPSALDLVTERDLANTLGIVDAFLPGSPNPKSREYVTRYRERFGKDTDFSFGPPYYDAAWMVARGIEAVGTDPIALRDWLRGLERHEGIAHDYACDAAGECVHGVWVARVKPGTKEVEGLQRITVE